ADRKLAELDVAQLVSRRAGHELLIRLGERGVGGGLAPQQGDNRHHPAKECCLHHEMTSREQVCRAHSNQDAHPPVGCITRKTGVPFAPAISGKNSRWVAGSTATECELLPGWPCPRSVTPGWLMSKTVRSPLSAAT